MSINLLIILAFFPLRRYNDPGDGMKKQRLFVLAMLGIGAATVTAAVYILAQYGWGIPCPVYRFTGWLCPGCGNTRAALSLLRLDVKTALGYNLLFPLEFGYLLWVILRVCYAYWQTGKFSYRPLRPWMDVVVLVAVVLWGIVRNII